MTVRDIMPWRKHEEPESLVPRDWFRTGFMDLQREINSLFDSFFEGRGLDFPRLERAFTPVVDVNETDEAIEVKAELPGMEEKDIEVMLDGHSLLLKGEKKREHEETEGGIHRRERSYGSFLRRIPIPVEVDEDKIKASFDKGVLNIKLPKTESGKARRIKVKKSA